MGDEGYYPMFALDQPGQVGRRGLLGLGLLLLALTITCFLALGAGQVAWPFLPAVITSQFAAMSVVTAMTAALLLGYARTGGRRGYLILGGTYLYVAGIAMISPAFQRNGVIATDPPSALLGGPQSSPALYSLWHAVFRVGIIVSALVINRDQARLRRPGLPRGAMARTVGGVALAWAFTLIPVTVLSQALPTMIEGGTRKTDFTQIVTLLQLTVLLAGVAYLGVMVSRRGSPINLWLLAVMLISLAETIVVYRRDLNLLTYYGNLALGLLSTLGLLMGLMWSLARVGRASEHAVAFDTATGTRSRASLLGNLSAELSRAELRGSTVALIWLDIDGFQAINDQYGHAIGDNVLREVARRARSCIRSGDEVGRLGGDEFGVLLCDQAGSLDPAQISGVAERMLARIREPVAVEGSEVLITASIGAVASSPQVTTAHELFARAGQAMTASKAGGGDRVTWYDPDMTAETLRRAQLRQDLAAALRTRSFEVDYQPIVDIATGAPRAAEALVRWVRDGERIPAAHFVNFAESTGQLRGIGAIVIERLAADLEQILAAGGPGFWVNLNLSVTELDDPKITDRILGGPLGAHVQDIMIEVTETMELNASTAATRNLARLRAAGFAVAVDDFGAGFSSIAQLADLAPRIIKIDRSLVVRAGSGRPGGVSQLTAAIALATSLDCSIIAEGVQTDDEHDAISAQGVELGQGFRYGRPSDLPGLLRLLTTTSVDA